MDISSVCKRVLPNCVGISSDFNSLLLDQSNEFVRAVFAQAKNKRNLDGRIEVSGDDLIWALNSLGLDQYAEVLSVYLLKYKASKL